MNLPGHPSTRPDAAQDEGLLYWLIVYPGGVDLCSNGGA